MSQDRELGAVRQQVSREQQAAQHSIEAVAEERQQLQAAAAALANQEEMFQRWRQETKEETNKQIKVILIVKCKVQPCHTKLIVSLVPWTGHTAHMLDLQSAASV